jgi:wobble nucleotide-excising tRNase
MINQFQKIVNVGCYDKFEFDSKKLKSFNKVNILYGSNGSGKTTFSNLMFLLSKHCKGKEQLLGELLDSTSELEILTSTGKVNHKTILSKNIDLYVFNSKFIADHVYDGTTTNIDSFSSDIKLTSPEIKILDTLILILQARATKIRKWDSRIEEKLESIFKVYNDEFQKKVKGSRLTNVKPDRTYFKTGDLESLKNDLEKLYKEYLNKSKEGNTIEKLTAIKLKIDDIQNIDINLPECDLKLSTKVSTDAKSKIFSRIHSYQETVNEKKLNEQVGDLNEWFRKGGRLLYLSKNIQNLCPLCDTDLSSNIDAIIKDYSDYFSDSILTLLAFIDNCILILGPFSGGKQIKRNTDATDELISSCNRLFNITIEEFAFSNNDLLIKAINELQSLLKEKKANPEKQLHFKKEYLDVLKEYCNAIEEFKLAAHKKIDEEISKIQSRSIDKIIKEIKEKINVICSVELNSKVYNVFESKLKTNSIIADSIKRINVVINERIKNLEASKTIEISKLNNESKFINLYLNHFGITNFSVERISEKAQDNLVITYSNTGKKKTKLSHSLSEGEKTALAFSYFISKLRVEKIEGAPNAFENCIIVIDDPISSLDDNRLFQTANLIDSFLFFNKAKSEIGDDDLQSDKHQPCQIFILSHSLTFVKYLHNALKTNSSIKSNQVNEYFLSSQSPIIKPLPTGLKNFTNTYIFKLKSIMDFKEKATNYEEVKNYLPNYIRIVLETFLSFKLACVNDDGKLPGMLHLINLMVKEFDLIDDIDIGGINKKGAIERLHHLKRIADHESHGSIYKAEEFSFISEDELKIFAKNTIQVINYIDNLHFKRVRSHMN